MVFICVPTPMSDDGSQDSSIIMKKLLKNWLSCPNAIKIVKSTVLPSLLDLNSKLDSKLSIQSRIFKRKACKFRFYKF